MAGQARAFNLLRSTNVRATPRYHSGLVRPYNLFITAPTCRSVYQAWLALPFLEHGMDRLTIYPFHLHLLGWAFN